MLTVLSEPRAPADHFTLLKMSKEISNPSVQGDGSERVTKQRLGQREARVIC